MVATSRRRAPLDAPRIRGSAAARPGDGRRRRLPRPGQRREQRQRRRALRLPAGLGGRGREHDGVADPVPLGEARLHDRREPARAARRTSLRRRGARTRSGCRPSWSRWRPTSPRCSAGRSRCNLLFRPAADRRRDHHRHRLAAAARAAQPARLARVRARGHRAGGDHRDRVLRRASCSPRSTAPRPSAVWCRTSPTPDRCCSPHRSSARR